MKSQPKRGSRRERPAIQWPKDQGLDAIAAFILERTDHPINRAAGKLSTFVNDCMNDADFRHPQSENLLTFLLIVRDSLTRDVNEQWTLDDILRPVATAVQSQSGTQGKGVPRPNRKTRLRRALEILIAEGLTNDQCFDELSDASAISQRAAHDGFPIEVCDPETSVKEDGTLRFYSAGGNSDNAEGRSIADLRRVLSAIRNPKKSA